MTRTTESPAAGRRLASARGFTLIELMVALGMALAVTTAALGVLLMVVDTQREGQKRNALARDAQLAMDLIAHDLGYAGVGVPRGYEADADGNLIGAVTTDAAAQLRPAIRIAQDDYLFFVGDLPYPNAELNGIAQPSMLQGNPANLNASVGRISVSSSLSGCAPGSGGGYVCDTTVSTTFDVGGSNCTSASSTQPTCPWGLKKWQVDGSGEVPLLFGSFDGRWWRRSWNMSSGGTDSNRVMIDFGDGDLPVNGFVGFGVGGGFIATLDRVFYSLDEPNGAACGGSGGCVLRRKQCWGWGDSLRPGDSSFPARLGTPPRLSGGTIASCDASAASRTGTPWEAVVEDVKSLDFEYFDATGAQLSTDITDAAELARIRTIRVTLVLERELREGITLDYTLQRQFYLENAGGLISDPQTTHASGGCWSGGPANECNPQ